MFGAAPKLEIRGKRKVKSCCGALVSFFAILAIVFYLAFKLLYYMQDIHIIRIFLDIVTSITGIELNEDVDLKMEFENDPDKYILNDWALV